MNTIIIKKPSMTLSSAMLFALLLGSSSSLANRDKSHYHGTMRSIPRETITFDQNSSFLTETDKATLRNLIQDARAAGPIHTVTVAAWSDKPLPRKGEKHSDVDRDLADARMKAIATYVRINTDIPDVDTYNMAEASNWLARMFGTTDAELKSVFSKKGGEAPVTNAEFQIIKNEGGPGLAVVVVERPVK